ncbi:PadR family transcriptional regulator [Lacticaseibacillus daqingensis]|uniref:PadR family transcriptional regulator n=1 Tax=Lacticaseibacillus daqingensis TaxID=2486014 RepID=UPI000F77518D|nr:PadR family transcriptional regulator [Lacticaseibacillus daqingensis]
MDSQLKKGLLEYSVLAALAPADSYGYQVIKDCPPALGVTLSTLYPLLRRLESDGRVTTFTRLHQGRARKYYHLTSLGRKSIQDFVAEWPQVETVVEQIQAAAQMLPDQEAQK